MDFDIYLVSLKNDVQRRSDLSRRFLKFFNDFIYIEAIDGRLLTAKDYYSRTAGFHDRNGRIMSPGELGCSLSHIQVLESFLKSSSEYALILEDDVIGCDEDIDSIQQLIPFLKEDSILVCGGQTGLLSRFFQFGRFTEKKGLLLVHPFSYQYMYRTCCYLVSRSVARYILKYQYENITVADHWSEIFRNRKVNFYYSNIMQHPIDLSLSMIENERVAAGSSSDMFSKIKSIRKVFRAFYSLVFVSLLMVFGYRRLK